MTAEILYLEFLYGLFVAAVAEYVAARFEGVWKRFLTFGLIAGLLIGVTTALQVLHPKEGEIVLRYIVYVVGLFFGLKFGNVAYQYRQIS